MPRAPSEKVLAVRIRPRPWANAPVCAHLHARMHARKYVRKYIVYARHACEMAFKQTKRVCERQLPVGSSRAE